MGMEFRIRKADGSIIIEDLDLDLAMHLRRKMENDFDAIVTLEVSTDDCTKLVMRGASNEDLGDDEDTRGYRMWLQGWWAGYQDTEVGLGEGKY